MRKINIRYNQGDVEQTLLTVAELLDISSSHPGATRWKWTESTDPLDLYDYDKGNYSVPAKVHTLVEHKDLLVPIVRTDVACVNFGNLYTLSAEVGGSYRAAALVRVRVDARHAAFLGRTPPLGPSADNLVLYSLSLGSDEALMQTYKIGLVDLQTLYDSIAKYKALPPFVNASDPRLALLGLRYVGTKLLRSDGANVLEAGMPPFSKWSRISELSPTSALTLLAKYSDGRLVRTSKLPATPTIGALTPSSYTCHVLFYADSDNVQAVWETFTSVPEWQTHKHILRPGTPVSSSVALIGSAPLSSGQRRLWYVCPAPNDKAELETFFNHNYITTQPCADGERPVLVLSAELIVLLLGNVLQSGMRSVGLLFLGFDQFADRAAPTPTSVELAVRKAFQIYVDNIKPYEAHAKHGSVLLYPALDSQQQLWIPSILRPPQSSQNVHNMLTTRKLVAVEYVSLVVQREQEVPSWTAPAMTKAQADELVTDTRRAMAGIPSQQAGVNIAHFLTTMARTRNNVYAIAQTVGVNDLRSRPAILAFQKKLIRIKDSKDVVAVMDDGASVLPIHSYSFERIALLEETVNELSDPGLRWLNFVLMMKWNEAAVLNSLTLSELAVAADRAKEYAEERRAEDKRLTVEQWLVDNSHIQQVLDAPLSHVIDDLKRHITEAKRQQFEQVIVYLGAPNPLSFRKRAFTPPRILDINLFPEIVAKRRFRESLPLSLRHATKIMVCQPELKEDPGVYPSAKTVNRCDGATDVAANASSDSTVGKLLTQKQEEARALLKLVIENTPLMWNADVVIVRLNNLYIGDVDVPQSVGIVQALVVLGVLEPREEQQHTEELHRVDETMQWLAGYRKDEPNLSKSAKAFLDGRSDLRKLNVQASHLQNDKTWGQFLNAEAREKLDAFAELAKDAFDSTTRILLDILAVYREVYLLDFAAHKQLPWLSKRQPLEMLDSQNVSSLAASIVAKYDELKAPLLAHFVKKTEKPIRARISAAPLRERPRLEARLDKLSSAATRILHDEALPRAAILKHIGADLPYTAWASLSAQIVGVPLRHATSSLMHDSLLAIGTIVEHQAGGRLDDFVRALGMVVEPPLSIGSVHTLVVQKANADYAKLRDRPAEKQALLSVWLVYAWAVKNDALKKMAAHADIPSAQAVVSHMLDNGDALSALFPQGGARTPPSQLLRFAILGFWPSPDQTVTYLSGLYYRAAAAHYAAASALWNIDNRAAVDFIRAFAGQTPGASGVLAKLSTWLSEMATSPSPLAKIGLFRTEFESPDLAKLRDKIRSVLVSVFNELAGGESNISDLLFHMDTGFTMIYNEWLAEQVTPYTSDMQRLLTHPVWTRLAAFNDPLRRGNILQHAFFRPDYDCAGMLDSALSTFFCSEIDPERVTTSLAEQVWDARIAELEKEVTAEPTGTARPTTGWLPADKLKFIRGRWNSAQLVQAALHMALDRVSSSGPAHVATLPMNLINKMLSKLLTTPTFVRWLQRYALDNRVHEAVPFKSVVPMAHRRPAQNYVRMSEELARDLSNALLSQAPAAMSLFGTMASRRYDIPASSAHELWRLAVFGPMSDPAAVMLDTETGDSALTTADLQAQLGALLELDSLLDDAIKAESLLASVSRLGLLSSVMLFVLTFLAAPDSTRNLFVQNVHPDGHVMFDYFHGDVVSYIARQVYAWPMWPPSEEQRNIAEASRAYLRSVDPHWLERFTDMIGGRDLTADLPRPTDEVVAAWKIVWRATVGEEARVPQESALASRPRLQTLSEPNVARLLLRYPRKELPYTADSDLKAGQALVYSFAKPEQWKDLSPLSGIRTQSDTAIGLPEGRDGSYAAEHANFSHDPRYSFYDWRVGRRYYYDPALGVKNSTDAAALVGSTAELTSALLTPRATLRLPELLMPQNLPFFYTVEWVLRNPNPSVDLLFRMAKDAQQILNISKSPGPTVLSPVKDVVADAHRTALRKGKVDELHYKLIELRNEWATQAERVRHALNLTPLPPESVAALELLWHDVDVLRLRYDQEYREARRRELISQREEVARNISSLPPLSDAVTRLGKEQEVLTTRLEELNNYDRATDFREAEVSAIQHRLDDAQRGLDEYTKYVRRIEGVVAPRLRDELRDLTSLLYPSESRHWLHLPQ